MGFEGLVAICLGIAGVQDVIAGHLDALHLLAIDLSGGVGRNRGFLSCLNAVVYYRHILQELTAGIKELAVQTDHVYGSVAGGTASDMPLVPPKDGLGAILENRRYRGENYGNKNALSQFNGPEQGSVGVSFARHML